MKAHLEFLNQAIELAKHNKIHGGRPFGAVIVKDGKVLSTGINEMLMKTDPSSHAEMEAIKDACLKEGKLTLEGCTVYASGHPCPMCLAAILMTKIEGVFYAFDNNDGAPYGYSSETTYQKLGIKKEGIGIPIEKLQVEVTADEVYRPIE